MNASPLPATIGPYKIESLFKKGGMSLIYLARHPKTSATVIVKVVLPQFLKNKQIVTRLIREARILGLADHPNIVKLYDLGQWENGLFIAMEFVQGISLKQFIKEKSFTHRRALEIVLQVASALLHLHGQGIVHRDIKPENILLTESGDIKLIDYGISQFVEAPGKEQITKRMKRIGTPNYMSPEQSERPVQVSYNADIFSLGIVTYELYLGRLCHGVVQTAFLPRKLKQIIDKALQIDPAKRYGDIVAFIADITQFLNTLDEAKEEVSDEISELVENAQTMLMLQKPPRFSDVEIGMAARAGSMFHNLYLDIFPLAQKQFVCVLGELFAPGIDSIPRSSLLRGIVRAAKTRAGDARHMIAILNQVLFEDPISESFNVSLLLLNSEKNALSFISCGDPRHSSLWYFRKNSREVQMLTVQNPPVGAGLQPDLLEIEENWAPGDTLFFSSFKPQEDITKHLLLPCQSLADLGLKTTPSSVPKRAEACLVIRYI